MGCSDSKVYPTENRWYLNERTYNDLTATEIQQLTDFLKSRIRYMSRSYPGFIPWKNVAPGGFVDLAPDILMYFSGKGYYITSLDAKQIESICRATIDKPFTFVNGRVAITPPVIQNDEPTPLEQATNGSTAFDNINHQRLEII